MEWLVTIVETFTDYVILDCDISRNFTHVSSPQPRPASAPLFRKQRNSVPLCLLDCRVGSRSFLLRAKPNFYLVVPLRYRRRSTTVRVVEQTLKESLQFYGYLSAWLLLSKSLQRLLHLKIDAGQRWEERNAREHTAALLIFILVFFLSNEKLFTWKR